MLDQLTLGIRLRDEANLESFFVGDNQEVVASIKALAGGTLLNYLYLYGPSGVGKSHLLQACCQYASSLGFIGFYLPLGQGFEPNILENLDHFPLVCVDNIQEAAADTAWEEALFHFFNRSLQQKTRLLIAGSNIPRQLPFKLNDLISRLASGVIYAVKALTDHQKLQTLQLRAHIRGFQLSEEVGQYLLNHYPRDMTALFSILETLDKASLEAQHRITIPFVKSILKMA